ncbi:MAG: BACON domain-containing protein [Prevotella sp.]|nr:BACON domain-containing protein [Prevotella sp.]
MKKFLNYALLATFAGLLGMSTVSCSDDDDNKDNDNDAASTVSVDNNLLTHGLEADMESGSMTVEIKSDGMWTATVSRDANWICIEDWQVTYNGNKTLTLRYDANASGADRTTTLNLGNSDGEYQKVTIRQHSADDNAGSGERFAGMGVGCGVDYDYALNLKLHVNDSAAFQPRKVKKSDNIFNITQIQKLQEKGIGNTKLAASAYVESPIAFAELKAMLLDSSLVQNKEVSLSLELGVSFGIIEFSAQGQYSAKKDENRTYVDYSIVRHAPMYNVYLSPAELSAYAEHNKKLDTEYEDQQYARIDELVASYAKQNQKRRRKNLDEDGLTPEQAEEIENMYDNIKSNFDYAGVFSVSFCDLYNELYNAITKKNMRNKEIDREKADRALNAIDNYYGPFFISGGDFGGALVMTMKVDNRYMEGADTFAGNLEADVSGMFNVSGKFRYTSTGFDVMHNSHVNAHVLGGNANDTANSLLQMANGEEPDDRELLQKILKDWVNSMYSPSDHDKMDQSLAEPLSFIITPVWLLFNETDIQEYAQNYFMEKYADRGIYTYMGIANGSITTGATTILNKNSSPILNP